MRVEAPQDRRPLKIVRRRGRCLRRRLRYRCCQVRVRDQPSSWWKLPARRSRLCIVEVPRSVFGFIRLPCAGGGSTLRGIRAQVCGAFDGTLRELPARRAGARVVEVFFVVFSAVSAPSASACK